jgi:hypothetical protein
VSIGGVVLGISAAAIALSGIRDLRMEIGGLLVHPYLPVTGVLFVAMLGRYSQLPRRILGPILFFVGFYILCTVPEYGGASEVVKFAAGWVTILTAAFTIRTERDLLAVTFGLTIAATFMAIQGIRDAAGAGIAGINPLEGIGNKNSFSLYALPALLLAVHAALHRSTPRWLRACFGIAALPIVFAIFSTANRSGYLGVLVIGATLSVGAGKRIRAVLLLGAIAGAAMYLFTAFGDTSVIERKIEATQQGSESDDVRQELIVASFSLALDHPVFGVSPQRLPLELARLVPSGHAQIDPHNTLAQVVGGCGFVGLVALIAMFWSMWRKPPEHGGLPLSAAAADAQFLLRAMIVLWVVRSFFTREILYNPSFAMGLGACLGLAAIRGVWRRPDP